MKPATCHPERPGRTLGLCDQCYQRQYYLAHSEGRTRRVPPVVTCHPERAHHALGLCTSCWVRQNGGRYRARLRQYGLTAESFSTMLVTQAGGCAICGTPVEEKNCHVDHDHETGHVRGLLCFGCNAGLGSFGDDERRLSAAIVYLRSARL